MCALGFGVMCVFGDSVPRRTEGLTGFFPPQLAPATNSGLCETGGCPTRLKPGLTTLGFLGSPSTPCQSWASDFLTRFHPERDEKEKQAGDSIWKSVKFWLRTWPGWFVFPEFWWALSPRPFLFTHEAGAAMTAPLPPGSSFRSPLGSYHFYLVAPRLPRIRALWLKLLTWQKLAFSWFHPCPSGRLGFPTRVFLWTTDGSGL